MKQIYAAVEFSLDFHGTQRNRNSSTDTTLLIYMEFAAKIIETVSPQESPRSTAPQRAERYRWGGNRGPQGGKGFLTLYFNFIVAAVGGTSIGEPILTKNRHGPGTFLGASCLRLTNDSRVDGGSCRWWASRRCRASRRWRTSRA